MVALGGLLESRNDVAALGPEGGPPAGSGKGAGQPRAKRGVVAAQRGSVTSQRSIPLGVLLCSHGSVHVGFLCVSTCFTFSFLAPPNGRNISSLASWSLIRLERTAVSPVVLAWVSGWTRLPSQM